MLSNISILIVNSSHDSIDSLTAILKAKILSKQRPNVTCLSQHDDKFSVVESLKEYLETFVSERVTECQNAIEHARKINEFNQLEMWKNELNKNNKKRQSNTSKKRSRNEVENKCTKNFRDSNIVDLILDSPNEHDFYLILFDVYDCDVIKAIAMLDDSLLLGVVNLHPRGNVKLQGVPKSVKFWQQLLVEKYKKSFENVAFIDMDVPVQSNYMLNIRSQLIYDQFCYFFYDFEHLKTTYNRYIENLVVRQVEVARVDNNDLKMLQKRLDAIPWTILSVDDIYEAIIEQIAQVVVVDSKMLSLKVMRKFMEIEAFGKRFYDMNDVWRKGYVENAEFYSYKIRRLEESCNVWNNIDTQQSIEQQQILNYFMHKTVRHLKWPEKGTQIVICCCLRLFYI